NREEARKELGIPEGKYLVLSFGGSLGAAPLNNAMHDILINNSESENIYHIHSAGTNGTAFLEQLEGEGFTRVDETTLRKGNSEVRKYINNMDTCLAAADLVIGRAGASSLSEIEALGKASILIPSPYVAENHQFHNAMALVNRNAARIIEEKDLTSESLNDMINELLSNPETLFEIEKNAREMGIPNSREKICEVIMSLTQK
ncbi:MAG: UDP-N-acetylglucosamine--N-acetylmuramyl-(pentapeptide) pyrophosphoryl-undecaprenol N-acetylglucosamine transferase, partial [Eubacterium sp.]|nr:UDP-N-acetylglucosamine--N-acetylmuramyl-(pentapeptide) pyrophosphoryl-undecaprenol N-acetylglucosamine transferase [Eubacterium sp.]